MAKRPPSRAARWSEAAQRAQNAWNELEAAMNDLLEVQQEYQDWKDNLPENLQQSALGEKLDAVCDLQLDPADHEIQNVIDEAANIDLPQGFGRD